MNSLAYQARMQTMVVMNGRSPRLVLRLSLHAIRECAPIVLAHFLRAAARGAIALSAFLLSILLCAQYASADTLFEGFSKIMVGDTHVGFFVQRNSWDPTTKEFSITYYLKTNANGGNVIESLKARSSKTLAPLSYQFTRLEGNKATVIDATFKNNVLNAIVKKDGKTQTIREKLPVGAFISIFLTYVIMHVEEPAKGKAPKPAGLKVGNNYQYQAIAAEEARVYKGEAFVSGEQTVNGVHVFNVKDQFKKKKWDTELTAQEKALRARGVVDSSDTSETTLNLITFTGETIGFRMPNANISAEIVPTLQEASVGVPFSQDNLKVLFGNVPRGQDNTIARKASTASSLSKQQVLEAKPAPPSNANPKLDGVPAGQGLILKGAPPAANPPSTSPMDDQAK